MADLARLDEMSDDQLVDLIAAAHGEQHRRAVERSDLGALTEHGFAEGFASTGMPRDPHIHGGLLVATGAKLERSSRPGMSHDCAFVSVGGTWVWEHPELLSDEIRNLPGARLAMRSVSLLAPLEGLELDLVSSQYRQGTHRLKAVRSFVVRSGAIELVSARAVSTSGHR